MVPESAKLASSSVRVPNEPFAGDVGDTGLATPSGEKASERTILSFLKPQGLGTTLEVPSQAPSFSSPPETTI